jgi:hypothetical protein
MARPQAPCHNILPVPQAYNENANPWSVFGGQAPAAVGEYQTQAAVNAFLGQAPGTGQGIGDLVVASAPANGGAGQAAQGSGAANPAGGLFGAADPSVVGGPSSGPAESGPSGAAFAQSLDGGWAYFDANGQLVGFDSQGDAPQIQPSDPLQLLSRGGSPEQFTGDYYDPSGDGAASENLLAGPPDGAAPPARPGSDAASTNTPVVEIGDQSYTVEYYTRAQPLPQDLDPTQPGAETVASDFDEDANSAWSVSELPSGILIYIDLRSSQYVIYRPVPSPSPPTEAPAAPPTPIEAPPPLPGAVEATAPAPPSPLTAPFVQVVPGPPAPRRDAAVDAFLDQMYPPGMNGAPSVDQAFARALGIDVALGMPPAPAAPRVPRRTSGRPHVPPPAWWSPDMTSADLWNRLIQPQLQAGKGISPPPEGWSQELRLQYGLMTDAERGAFAEREWSIWRGPHVSQQMPENWDALGARLDRWGIDEASNDAVLQGFSGADTVGLAWGAGRYVVGKAAFQLEGALTSRGFWSEGAAHETGAETQWGARIGGDSSKSAALRSAEDWRAGRPQGGASAFAEEAGYVETGARRVFGPTDWGSAVDAAYDAIRTATEDVTRIAANTGFSADEIALLKDHIFNNTHVLDDGVVARFDEDPFIANAWGRLTDGTHNANDIVLLQHELFELEYELTFQSTYREAHAAAIQAGYVWKWEP